MPDFDWIRRFLSAFIQRLGEDSTGESCQLEGDVLFTKKLAALVVSIG